MDEVKVQMHIKASPKDVFLHLFSMVTLYGSVISLITLLFQYINIAVPDDLMQDYYYRGAYQSIRFAVASLIVLFPAYIWVTWFLNKMYASEPDKRNLRISKWLIYLTLFIAGLVILGDLVSLIYNFLGGEVTLRFILKMLAVLLVAGAVFWYYYWDLKQHKIE